MEQILLINPSFTEIYQNSFVSYAVPNTPPLSLALIAKPLLEENYEVKILDLGIEKKPSQKLKEVINKYNPKYVGFTINTPLFAEVKNLVDITKKVDKNIITFGGGHHISILPEETIKDTKLDIGIMGEGEITTKCMIDAIEKDKKLNKIDGLVFRKNKKIFSTKKRELIKNLDSLPFPAFQLYNLKEYKSSYLSVKNNPACYIETGRGCIFNCTFCHRMFGKTYRTKSPIRVVNEIKYLLNLGFKEILIADDGFTTNLNRAKLICDMIKKEKLEFTWSLDNGIRVDNIDYEFLKKAYDSGCYRVCFGIESGDQQILNKIKKGITLDQVKKAVLNARNIGLETLGFFMVGLPGETKESIYKTIKFAKSLDLDFVKLSITTPLPGTELFDELEKNGCIKTKDWKKYKFSSPENIFEHPTLNFSDIYDFYNYFYKQFYFRPSFIYKRFKKSIKEKNVLNDIKFLTKFKL